MSLDDGGPRGNRFSDYASGADGGLHYRRGISSGIVPQNSEELFSTHQIQLIINPESGIPSFDLTDFSRDNIARLVLSVLAQYSLALSSDHPRIAFILEGSRQSQQLFDGKPCSEFFGKIMIFTTTGPKHFPCSINVPSQNSRVSSVMDRVRDALPQWFRDLLK